MGADEQSLSSVAGNAGAEYIAGHGMAPERLHAPDKYAARLVGPCVWRALQGDPCGARKLLLGVAGLYSTQCGARRIGGARAGVGKLSVEQPAWIFAGAGEASGLAGDGKGPGRDRMQGYRVGTAEISGDFRGAGGLESASQGGPGVFAWGGSTQTGGIFESEKGLVFRFAGVQGRLGANDGEAGVGPGQAEPSGGSRDKRSRGMAGAADRGVRAGSLRRKRGRVEGGSEKRLAQGVNGGVDSASNDDEIGLDKPEIADG